MVIRDFNATKSLGAGAHQIHNWTSALSAKTVTVEQHMAKGVESLTRR
jgi:hypothetical protein